MAIYETDEQFNQRLARTIRNYWVKRGGNPTIKLIQRHVREGTASIKVIGLQSDIGMSLSPGAERE